MFVRKIDRLGHRISLENMIESLVDADFCDNPNLYYLITTPDCTIEDRNRCKSKEQTRVWDLLNGCFSDENVYKLHIECVDLKSMSASEKQKFRNHFWNSAGRSVSEEVNPAAGWERRTNCSMPGKNSSA